MVGQFFSKYHVFCQFFCTLNQIHDTEVSCFRFDVSGWFNGKLETVLSALALYEWYIIKEYTTLSNHRIVFLTTFPM